MYAVSGCLLLSITLLLVLFLSSETTASLAKQNAMKAREEKVD
jgi:hypothetical protein